MTRINFKISFIFTITIFSTILGFFITDYNTKNTNFRNAPSILNIENVNSEYYNLEIAGTNYKRIEVNINLQNNNVIEQFKYPSSLIDSIIDDIVITNRTTGTTTLEDADNSLIAITDVENELLIELSNLGVSNPNSSQLQSLTANIANIIIEDSITDSNWIIGSQQIMNRQKRADLIKSVLNIDINFRDEKNAIAERTSQDVIDELKEIVLKYYQFMQFKRAYFDCTEVKYDKNTGRICEMNFEIRTDSSGNVEFN